MSEYSKRIKELIRQYVGVTYEEELRRVPNAGRPWNYFPKLPCLADAGGIEGSSKWIDEANSVQDKAVLEVLAQNQRDLVQPGRRPHLRIPVIQPMIPYPSCCLEDNQGRDSESRESADQGSDLAVRVAGA